jgi:signal recognition particle receptor subunit beta
MTSKIEFFNLLVNNDLKDASILILANKQDLPTAKDAAELTEAYSLNEIQNHSWKI